MKNKIPDLTGKTFRRLFVVERFKRENRTLYRCRCECGNEVIAMACKLVSGNTKSCGCWARDFAIQNGKKNATHGLSRTPTGNSWHGMMKRCYNKKQKGYKDYGAKGVYACEFIRATPINLKLLIGLRPERHTLDRINVLGSYTCGTCAECLTKGDKLNIQWSSYIRQGRNKRNSRMLTIGGITKQLGDWADEYGLVQSALYYRVTNGWPEEKLLQPSRKATN